MQTASTVWTEKDSLILALAQARITGDDIGERCLFCSWHSYCVNEGCTYAHSETVRHDRYCPVVRARKLMGLESDD